MKETQVLSKIFESDPDYEITMFRSDLEFAFKNKTLRIEKGFNLTIISEMKEEAIYFAEIKEIKITPKTVVFYLEDAGFNYKDGDVKILRRKKHGK